MHYAFLLLRVLYTRLMRISKVETDCGGLTGDNGLLYGAV